MLSRGIRDLAKRGLFGLHRAGLKAGLVVLPKHYYTPIADIRHLEKTRAAWAVRSSMHGIDIDAARQLQWLRDKVLPFESEYRGNRRYREAVEASFGPGYGYIEAQCLHGVIRALKPARIIEVGSGNSTHVMLGALEMNEAEGHAGRLTCVEPFPSDYLKGNRQIELINSPVEQLDPATFDVLEAGDLLFIDSSHAIRPGGDVAYLYLSVVPRLKPGVHVHIHDIYFPYLYQRDLLQSLFQWEETLLLAALLTDNRRLSITSCLSQLHYDEPEGLREVFPEYRRAADSDGLAEASPDTHFPASIYLQTH